MYVGPKFLRRLNADFCMTFLPMRYNIEFKIRAFTKSMFFGIIKAYFVIV